MSRRSLPHLASAILSICSILIGLNLIVEPAFAVQSEIAIQSEAASFNPNDFSMTLSPSTQTLDLEPNDTYDGLVNVINSGKIPITFTVEATPFYIANDDYSPDYEAVNRYTELASWVHFDQTEYRINPGETAEVEFHIRVPATAVGGGQYAAIMIYSEDSANPDATIRTASRLAAILYGHVSGEAMTVEGTITNRSLPWLITDSPLIVSASAQNTGNVDFTIRQTVTVKNFFTNEEYLSPETVDADGNLIAAHETVIMPNTSRTDTITWKNTPRLGLYRVEQAITILGETTTEEKLVLFCPLWLIIAVITLVALLILWIVLAIVKRHRNRPQVF